MRGWAVLLAVAAWPAPASAQSAVPGSAEEFMERAAAAYSPRDDEFELEPCPEATEDEIVVCRQYRDFEEDFRLASPTERAYAEGEPPPDPIPGAQHIFDPPPCIPSLLSLCLDIRHPIAATPLIDLEAIPEPLTPEEAARVVRAEERPPATAP